MEIVCRLFGAFFLFAVPVVCANHGVANKGISPIHFFTDVQLLPFFVIAFQYFIVCGKYCSPHMSVQFPEYELFLKKEVILAWASMLPV